MLPAIDGFLAPQPNAARVNVPDERFNWLCNLYRPKSSVSAYLDVVDIAGLVRKGLDEPPLPAAQPFVLGGGAHLSPTVLGA
jgi:hypothetical protein